MLNWARKTLGFLASLFREPWRRQTWICLALAAVTLATYCRVARFEFIIYDDLDYVSNNPHVRSGLTTDGLAWAFVTLHPARTYWHPLAWVSHMVDCQLFGLKAGAHHLVSVLFHTANVLLVFLLLRRLTGAVWRSAMVAALFALHPLQVDSVAWVTERKNLLSTLFWLLTLLAYARYAAAPGWRRYGLVALGFALALLSKVAIVTLPCVLLLLDFWPLQRFAWARRFARPAAEALPAMPLSTVPRLLLEKVPLFALAGVAVVLLFGSQRQIVADISAQLPFSDRLGNALFSYVRYLGKTFWPHHLSIFYVHPGHWPDAYVAGSAALLVLISAFVLWRARRVPALLIGWLWFLGVLVPMIGLIQAGDQAMADRFAYVPLIGLFIALVWGVAALAARWPHRVPILSAAAALALGACLVLTSRQLSYWKSSLTLFEHILSFDPDNFVAHNNLGSALGLLGRDAQALPHFRKATELRPTFGDAYCNWGICLKGLGKNLPLAKEKFLQSLELDATLEPAYCNLAAMAEEEGRWDQAIDYYRRVLQVRPDFPQALNDLGVALQHQGRLEEAGAQFAAVMALDPRDGAAYANLASLRLKQNRPEEAIAQFRAAHRRTPYNPQVINNLAWLLATQTNAALRNGPEALALAERAATLTGRTNANVLGTLAAAYAELGQFTNAVAAALQAEQLARAARDTNSLAAKTARVALFRSGQPVREP
jgi:protein O-mannosyl-transferase